MTRRCYGGIAAYNASETIPINGTSSYPHSVTGLTLLSTSLNCTAISSSDKIVSVISDNGSGKIRCTSTGHGFSTGDVLCLSNSETASYNAKGLVTWVDANTFDILSITYVNNVTAIATRGSGIKIAAGCGGQYIVGFVFNGSCSASVVVKVALNINATTIDACSARLATAAGLDFNMTNPGTVVQLTSGDVIWMSIINATDATDFTMYSANINIIPVK